MDQLSLCCNSCRLSQQNFSGIGCHYLSCLMSFITTILVWPGMMLLTQIFIVLERAGKPDLAGQSNILPTKMYFFCYARWDILLLLLILLVTPLFLCLLLSCVWGFSHCVLILLESDAVLPLCCIHTRRKELNFSITISGGDLCCMRSYSPNMAHQTTFSRSQAVAIPHVKAIRELLSWEMNTNSHVAQNKELQLYIPGRSCKLNNLTPASST